jgi:hypothetical protein
MTSFTISESELDGIKDQVVVITGVWASHDFDICQSNHKFQVHRRA